MTETSTASLAGSPKQLALRLLRRRAFTAGYLTQVIDLAVREVARSQFDEPDEREAAQVHRRLTRYAANGHPGSAELARAMLDVKHALVVLAQNEETSIVYRPVSAVQAKALRQAARSAKEEAIRLYEGAVEVLRPHVRMADWSKDDGYGVAVDVVRDGVSVQWWPAALPESRALWEQGGIRQLCVSLLASRFTVSEADDGAPHAMMLRL
ncbi:hypothetical protein [Streptomyces sp. NPDC090994]|uniref:hypothetical protein n=1 Tax=Streptomyces sp. NPDC090994 TaxID=3365969 RepID=UPI00381CD043